MAPERRLPQPVRDLAGVVRDDAIELTWTNPRQRVDGSALADLATARIFRTEDAGTGEVRPAVLARGRIPGYTEIATLALDEVEPTDGRLLHADRRELSTGRRYTYVVVTADSLRRDSAPSARVSVTYIAAPPALEAVTAEAGDGEARLSWTAPTSLRDGSPSEPSPTTSCAPSARTGLSSPSGAPTPASPSPSRAPERPDLCVLCARHPHGRRHERVRPSQRSRRGDARRHDAPRGPYGRRRDRVSGRRACRGGPAPMPTWQRTSCTGPRRVGSSSAGLHPGHGHHVHGPGGRPGSYRYAVAAQDGGSRANESAVARGRGHRALTSPEADATVTSKKTTVTAT